MTQGDEPIDEDGGGYDVDDWSRLKAFTGVVATLDDVQARKAVFALGDTEEPRVIDMELPQPVIWWEDDGEQAAVIVQAEAHVGSDDVDLVDDTDPTWRDLVANAIDAGEDD
jgi:hypothetical protein